MKKLLVSAAITSSVLLTVPAQANEALTEGICGAVETNDKKRLRKILKNNKVRIRNIYEALQCDGQSLLRFAMTHEANAVGAMVAKKLPVKKLSEPEADGKTISDWAAEFGHGDSLIIQSVNARIGG